MDKRGNGFNFGKANDTKSKIFQQYMEFEGESAQDNQYPPYGAQNDFYDNQMEQAPYMNFQFNPGFMPQMNGKLFVAIKGRI
jgi:hypothetical protein